MAVSEEGGFGLMGSKRAQGRGGQSRATYRFERRKVLVSDQSMASGQWGCTGLSSARGGDGAIGTLGPQIQGGSVNRK